MTRHTRIAVLLLVAGVLLASPLEARAQGFWDFIHRMSGPAFKKSVGVQLGVCLNSARRDEERRRCLTLGSAIPPEPSALTAGPVRHESPAGPRFALGSFLDGDDAGGGPSADAAAGADPAAAALSPAQAQERLMWIRPAWEWQLAFAASYGWDGTNEDRDIANVSLVMLEPQLRVLYTRMPHGGPFLGIGIGEHRFAGSGVPEPFWATATVLHGGYRLEFRERDELPTVYIEVSAKVRYFFDRIESARFGGTPEPGAPTDGGEWVMGLMLGGGYRFNWGG